METRSKNLLFICFTGILLISGVVFIMGILWESGSVVLDDGESYSCTIGFVSSGGTIQVEYHSYHASIDFFIVNQGNYSRWQDDLPFDRYSFAGGRFNFTVPYSDTWYAIFNKSSTSFWWADVEYVIIPPFSPFDYVVISMSFGSLGSLAAVFIIHVRDEYLRAGPPITERIAERTTELPYEEDAMPEEVPGLICSTCGHENPLNADFCIGCGRDLDPTDDVSRY